MFELKTCKNSNNELRLTLLPVRKQGVTLREKAAAFLSVPDSEVEEYSSVKPSDSALLDLRCEFKTKAIRCSAHSHKRTKFGRYAKTRIIRAAGALDTLDPEPTNYLFLTATLPSDEEWAKWAIAEDSHNLINGFKAWLSKRVKSRHEFYVWEHQGRGALHFHYCIHVPDVEVRDAIARDFRAQWMRLLDGMSARTGVCAWGRHASLDYEGRYGILQTRAEIVRESVSKYMAGYCGGKKDKHSKDARISYYPKRWFGVSRGLSALVREQTENDTETYPNYRGAKLAFDKLSEEFSADSLTSKSFKHKIGKGETSVHYHTPKNLKDLWQARKTMKYPQSHFPNTASLIKELESIMRTCSELETNSQLFRATCSKRLHGCLLDSLFLGSVRKGSLHDRLIPEVDALSSDLASLSTLPPTLEKLSKSVRRFMICYSQNHPNLRWNKHGWLCIENDLPYAVDKLAEVGEHRTRRTDEGTQSGIPSEPNQMATVVNPDSQQMSLI